jgi:serine/threonine-protein kinase HipA
VIVAEVKLWETRIGVVAFDADSPFCTFRYDPDFVRTGINVSPIMMPLSNAIYQFKALSLESFRGLPGLLSDSLPDKYGNAIIDAWLEANGRTKESFSVIERLCYIGSRGMGALEFFPTLDIDKELNESEEIEVKQLVELSRKILSQKNAIMSKDKDKLDEIIKVGTSAGGARAKAIIAYNEKTGLIKSGQIDAGRGYTYWILKLGGVNQDKETPYTRIEYAYYLMAKEAKIIMSESRLKYIDKQFHFMTRRFDRVINEDGSVGKVHMQTLGALMHIDYREPGIISYEGVVQMMYKLGMKQSETEQFFRRMVFNVMSINCDDHVKNISFLMDRNGKWSLSPAYDVTYSYNPQGDWTYAHQMLINGKKSDISKNDLIKSAQAMKIKEEKALEIIGDVKKALLKWKDYAEQAHLDAKTIADYEIKFILY